jgi:hypothetical protein
LVGTGTAAGFDITIEKTGEEEEQFWLFPTLKESLVESQ